MSFAYPSRPERLALNDTTFTFPAGETTFVIGKSGSGKSTLSNLILQFYFPASGEILLDGRRIESLNTHWLRNNITLVQQETILFNETLFNNIAIGRFERGINTKAGMQASLELADLEATILNLPERLDTIVGTGGRAMSGGQRQRIAIARARLRDAPVLILDEATSALDQASKIRVMDAIRAWRRNKTTIIITHDTSQIQASNYVYVLEHGRVIQEGYRTALERSFDEPFSRIFGLKTRSAIVEEDSDSDYQDSRASSVYSQDSLDIDITERKTLVPQAYRQTEREIKEWQGPSQASLAPVAAHLHRMASNRASMRPLRRYGKDVRIVPSQPSRPGSIAVTDPKRDSRQLPPSGNEIQESLRDLGKRLSTRLTVWGPDPPQITPQPKPAAPEDDKLSTKDHEAKDQPVESAVHRPKTLRQILSTVWRHFHGEQRIVLVAGFVAASTHAAATPVFSWVFSKLLGTFFGAPDDHAHKATVWSLAVLLVAAVDALASFFMHFLLEKCGQSWVDSLRAVAMQHVLDQPRAFFEQDENAASTLSECLDRNAEEMRNLVGRFAGLVFVAATMVVVAVVWSAILAWKLTLVGLATAPLLYAISSGFEGISGRWEAKCNEAAQAASSVFTETFTNIRTIRALTLEGYFHQKFAKAATRALKIGIKRGLYSGVFFGLSDSVVPFVVGPFLLARQFRGLR